MNEILNNNNEDDIHLPSDDIDENQSLKLYQAIYNKITGRSERLTEKTTRHIKITIDEIKNIDDKIKQVCSLHNIISCNQSITVTHTKNRQETFTSYDRFRIYNTGNPSPCLTVTLTYNISMLVNGTNEPQHYRVSVKINSRLGLVEKIRKEAPPFLSDQFLPYLLNETAELKIDYVDYIVARGFSEAFTEWANGCPVSPEHPWLKKLQKLSHLIPRLGKVAIILIGMWYALAEVEQISNSPIEEQVSILGRTLIVYSASIYALVSIAHVTLRMIEDAIDSYTPASYIKLNKGDAQLIDAHNFSRRWSAGKLVGGVLLSIAIGYLSSKLSQFF